MDRRRGHGQEAGLLADRIEQRHAAQREGRRQGQSRVAGPAAEVEERGAPAAPMRARRWTALRESQTWRRADLGRLADGRQVDGRAPLAQQPGVELVARGAPGPSLPAQRHSPSSSQSGLQRVLEGVPHRRQPQRVMRQLATRRAWCVLPGWPLRSRSALSGDR